MTAHCQLSTRVHNDTLFYTLNIEIGKTGLRLETLKTIPYLDAQVQLIPFFIHF